MTPANAPKLNTPPCPDPLRAIDYHELRRQKKFLDDLLRSTRQEGLAVESSYLVGVLYLIDSLQDYAVNECGRDSREVWGR